MGTLLRPYRDRLDLRQSLPRGRVKIDWSHPLTRGLTGAWLPTPYGINSNLVDGRGVVMDPTVMVEGQPLGYSQTFLGGGMAFTGFNATPQTMYSPHQGYLVGDKPYLMKYLNGKTSGAVSIFAIACLSVGGNGAAIYGERGNNNDIFKLSTARGEFNIVIRDDGGTLVDDFSLFANPLGNTCAPGDTFPYAWCLTYDIASGTYIGYIDGVNIHSGTYTGTTNYTDTSSAYIGGEPWDPDGGQSFCSYPIYLVFIYTGVALSVNDIAFLSNEPFCFLQTEQMSLPALAVASTSFSMAAATGYYSVTGEAATLLDKHILSAATGTYSLTGEAASGKLTVSAATGTYALTGEAATTLWAHKLPAATGYYSLTGEAATLALGMSEAAGYYSLTGEATTLKWGHKLSAATGTYALTGEAATTLWAHKEVEATGSYALTGEAATLALKMTAATGYYNLAGEAVTLSTTGAFALQVNSGFFAVTGEADTQLWAHKLVVADGTYALTGEAATLTAAGSVTLAVATGFFALTGEANTELWAHKLVVADGVYTVTGEATIGAISLAAATGYYNSTGEADSLLVAHKVAAAAGFFALTGESNAFGLGMVATSGYYSMTGETVKVMWAHDLVIAAGKYALTGEAISLNFSGAFSVTATPSLLGTKAAPTLQGQESTPTLEGNELYVLNESNLLGRIG
jgi:hypothetical protein